MEDIREQMGRPELGEIAAFYKLDMTQLIRWSTAAFVPEDLPSAPNDSCCFVQRESFGHLGYDVSADRTDKEAHQWATTSSVPMAKFSASSIYYSAVPQSA